MNLHKIYCITVSALFTLNVFSSSFLDSWSADKVEEEGGACFDFLFNPSEKIYGLIYNVCVWIRSTPIFGKTSVGFMRNGILDCSYGIVGITLRLMPRKYIAPFIGGICEFNYSFSSDKEYNETANYFWSTSGESGLRIGNKNTFIEIAVRYTKIYTDASDNNYFLIVFLFPPR